MNINGFGNSGRPITLPKENGYLVSFTFGQLLITHGDTLLLWREEAYHCQKLATSYRSTMSVALII
ncbi:hypothetical protein BGP75_16185 [Motiliproteus sp. MSK22-1]|nr:hypothetical protein BGP75_16185 [Motiliproteus sp. MSK22-1]